MRAYPIFGTGLRSYSEAVCRQRRVNCFYDQRKDQDKNAVVVLGTPGSVQWVLLDSSPVYGHHVIDAYLYVVAGQSLYRIDSAGSTTYLGPLPTVGRNVSMSDNSAQLLIVDGVAGYIFDLSALTLTTISDVNFPNGTTSVTFLNSSFYAQVPSSRTFVKSALLDGTTWTPYTFGTKEKNSDQLILVDTLKDTLVLYGDQSCEFWQDVGTSPLPVQYITGSAVQWGIAAPNSLAHIGNTAMFLAKNPDGGISVVKWSGFNADVVSDSDVESLIGNMAFISDAIALVYHAFGHSFYQITFPSANRTLCYDFTSGIWGETQTTLAVTSRHYANLGVAFNKKNIFSDASTGNLYYFDQTVNTDNGVAILRELCTRHIYSEGNYQYLDEFFVEMEVGQGDGNLGLEVSRDGGNTFGPQKQKTIGPVGQYTRRVRFRRLGQGDDMVLRLRMTDDLPFVITSGSVNMDVTNA